MVLWGSASLCIGSGEAFGRELRSPAWFCIGSGKAFGYTVLLGSGLDLILHCSVSDPVKPLVGSCVELRGSASDPVKPLVGSCLMLRWSPSCPANLFGRELHVAVVVCI